MIWCLVGWISFIPNFDWIIQMTVNHLSDQFGLPEVNEVSSHSWSVSLATFCSSLNVEFQWLEKPVETEALGFPSILINYSSKLYSRISVKRNGENPSSITWRWPIREKEKCGLHFVWAWKQTHFTIMHFFFTPQMYATWPLKLNACMDMWYLKTYWKLSVKLEKKF